MQFHICWLILWNRSIAICDVMAKDISSYPATNAKSRIRLVLAKFASFFEEEQNGKG
jgi:hypothetical protein